MATHLAFGRKSDADNCLINLIQSTFMNDNEDAHSVDLTI